MSCVSRHQGRTAWCLPAKDRSSRGMAETADTIRAVGRASSKASAARQIWARYLGRAVLDRALDLNPQFRCVLMFVDGDLIAANTANGTV